MCFLVKTLKLTIGYADAELSTSVSDTSGLLATCNRVEWRICDTVIGRRKRNFRKLLSYNFFCTTNDTWTSERKTCTWHGKC